MTEVMSEQGVHHFFVARKVDSLFVREKGSFRRKETLLMLCLCCVSSLRDLFIKSRRRVVLALAFRVIDVCLVAGGSENIPTI